MAKSRGYSGPSAFLRAAIEKELGDPDDGIIGAEERLTASIEQVRREVFRLGHAQQALFAFVDSIAKVLLTCMPLARWEALEAAVARARSGHARLLKNAGQAMAGDSLAAMQDLVDSWRRMTITSSGVGRGSSPHGANARLGRRRTRS